MELSKQVVNLELSKRLKELGVKQDGLFSWVCRIGRKNYGEADQWYILKTCDSGNFKGDCIASAFTVAELGEMLPMGTKFEKYSCKGKPRFCVIEVESIANMSIHDHNEADARAKMLIYLIEQGIVRSP